jgi:hypothetical protein
VKEERAVIYDLSEPPAAEATGPTVGTATERASTYLPAATLTDVLFEQLDYLLTHAGNCLPGCSDCGRLEQVKRCLLQPFGNEYRPA